MKVYFDNNCLQDLVFMPNFSNIIEKIKINKFKICLSQLNIYEFARCFLSENNVETGKKIFNKLSPLLVDFYIHEPKELINRDLEISINNYTFKSVFLNDENIIRTKLEINNFSRGFYLSTINFLEKREAELRKFYNRYGDEIRKSFANFTKPQNFEEFRDNWDMRRKVLEKSEFSEKAKLANNSILFSEPAKFPYLNTYINVVLYENFIALENIKGPSPKTASDHKHIIIANAAECFVTNDDQILNNSKIICPYSKLQILKLQDFLKMVNPS